MPQPYQVILQRLQKSPRFVHGLIQHQRMVFVVERKPCFRVLEVGSAIFIHCPNHHACTFVLAQVEVLGEIQEHVSHCLAGMHH